MPVTSFHLFEGATRGKLRLLRDFGLLRIALPTMPGVQFGKAMGCGRGSAFSILPDWERWAVLMECMTEADERTVMASKQFKALQQASKQLRSWRLYPIRKKGMWDGQSPFGIVAYNGGPEVAVLTRADIPALKVPAFVRHSYKTTETLKAAPGLSFSLGMGELPFLRQATFTIWESDEAMTAYAYKDQHHIAAMKAKAQSGMFSEEMFVRFRIGPLPLI